ncbi:MAG: hypothetical protein U5L08_05125 [Xanthomonadales bacterium]|nr:hypothetical protein [Xanthomonadales bacterium]
MGSPARQVVAETLREILRTQFGFLAFRRIRPNLEKHAFSYLVYVFTVTWIVGIGRYWDHPDAYLWQSAGLGSVAYIVLLSLLIYLVALPLRPVRWSYRMVLVFVGLTSLPALLYAVPVERFLPLEAAQTVNAWFLAVVAAWRVALYVRFLITAAGLGAFETAVATVLPISAIVVALAVLDLEHVVFSVMAGIREDAASPNDAAYSVVFTLSIFAFVAFPLTLIGYAGAIYRRIRNQKKADGQG